MSKATGTRAEFSTNADDIYKLQEAFKASGKDAMKAARNVTNEVGKAMVAELKGAGMVGQGQLASYVARKSVKAERKQVFKGKDGVVRVSKFTGGYIPVVAIGKGGELPVSRKGTEKNPRPTAEQVWAGTEFGAMAPLPNGAKRFRKRIKNGYWFFPTWTRIKDQYAEVWQQKMATLISSFERG